MKNLTTDFIIKVKNVSTIMGVPFCIAALLLWVYFTSNGLALSPEDPSKTEIKIALVYMLIGIFFILLSAICWAILSSRDLNRIIESQNKRGC